jgi:hypothetical protein
MKRDLFVHSVIRRRLVREGEPYYQDIISTSNTQYVYFDTTVPGVEYVRGRVN